jgi:twitching motility protein PilJ
MPSEDNAAKSAQSVSILPLWQRLSLKTKAIVLAIAIGTIPVLVSEAIEFWHETDLLKDRIVREQEAKAILLADGLSRFASERLGDLDTIANLPILNNAKVAAETSLQSKQETFNQFLKTHSVYDSVVFADLTGKPIVAAGIPAGDNYRDTEFFRETLKTKALVITPPRRSTVTGVYSIFLAAPVVETTTGKIVGVVRTRIPATKVEEPLENNPYLREYEHLFVDRRGTIFAATKKEYVGKAASELFPAYASLAKQNVVATRPTTELYGNKILASYAPLPQLVNNPNLNWGVVMAQDANILQGEQQQLLLIYLGLMALSAIFVGAIAAWLANRLTRPILKAASAVQKIGQGELDTRLSVKGEDELAVLGTNINRLANQIQTLLRRKEDETERILLVKDIALNMGQSLNIGDIFKAAVEGIRQALRTDRVTIYQFNDKWAGKIVAESTAPNCPSAMDAKLDASWFAQGYLDRYQQGQVVSTPNIYNAGLTEEQLKQLEPFAVKASLTAPILVERQLMGLLVAHHCSEPRSWQQAEIDLFLQLATQVGLAWERSQEQHQQKELLQFQLLELLDDLEGVARGNLVLQADMNLGDTDAIAKFFQVITESLREAMERLGRSTVQIHTAISEDERAIKQISNELLKQSEKTELTLKTIEPIALSFPTVIACTQQATNATQTALATAESEKKMVNRKSENISSLLITIDEIAQKLQLLSGCSQQLSSSITLFNQITQQTKVIAINAKLNAERLGEEGSSFAEIATQTDNLAVRSQESLQTLEQIANNLHRETIEVLKVVDLSNTWLVEENDLVEDSRRNLAQKLSVLSQLDQLVQSISTSTRAQAQMSQTVTTFMQELINTCQQMSAQSRQVSLSLHQTKDVVQQLESSTTTFNVSQ